jgi:hypothetical protein
LSSEIGPNLSHGQLELKVPFSGSATPHGGGGLRPLTDPCPIYSIEGKGAQSVNLSL